MHSLSLLVLSPKHPPAVVFKQPCRPALRIIERYRATGEEENWGIDLLDLDLRMLFIWGANSKRIGGSIALIQGKLGVAVQEGTDEEEEERKKMREKKKGRKKEQLLP